MDHKGENTFSPLGNPIRKRLDPSMAYTKVDFISPRVNAYTKPIQMPLKLQEL